MISTRKVYFSVFHNIVITLRTERFRRDIKLMIKTEDLIILGIESSCDDTSCAVIKNGVLLSNLTAGQKIHEQYGGVVPELASRDHQKNIVPVVYAALQQAGVSLQQVSAIAVTRGPGLMGSLLVGLSFAKSLALSLNIPLLEVNHMQGHILAHFLQDEEAKTMPAFPFLCLTVSGGHTQIVRVDGPRSFHLLGETIDDAVGEAFDKAAKILGLPYPGGPLIDRYAKEGNPLCYSFPRPQIPGLDYSFSGIKTAFLYFIQEQTKANPNFVKEHLADICASYQHHLVQVLLHNLKQAARQENIRDVAIAGGVSANSALRKALTQTGEELGWRVFIPRFEYCTDNAAMIAITGYYKYLEGDFAGMDLTPLARYAIG